MVPVIPQKRRDGGSSFDDLVSYIVVRDHEEMDKKYQKVEACELRGRLSLQGEAVWRFIA